MSAARREPARAVRAGQVSGPESVVVGVVEGALGVGVDVVAVDGESTFAAAAIALEKERAVVLPGSEAGETTLFRIELPRRGAARGRDERRRGEEEDDDDDASAAVETLLVVERESRIVLLVAAPSRVFVGNARSWLQRRARRPRRIQRWRRPEKFLVSSFLLFFF